MDEERRRWITRPATLDRVEMGIRFSETPSGLLATYSVLGHCDRKRGALWAESDTVPTGPDVMDLHDHVHALLTAMVTHRPTTEANLLRSLTGEHWRQGELPW